MVAPVTVREKDLRTLLGFPVARWKRWARPDACAWSQAPWVGCIGVNGRDGPAALPVSCWLDRGHRVPLRLGRPPG